VRTLGGVGSTPRSGVDAARWYRPDADLTLPERPDTGSVDAEAELERYEAVRAALSAVSDDRVVVRTLDVGGDKPVPYLDLPDEPNPFLGRRGIRLSLDEHADLFETQLRALLRAAATDNGDGLAVMFLLVTRVEEVERGVGETAMTVE
jgi:phosphoenolpyruvate-protein kinase (PTS system EI component)